MALLKLLWIKSNVNATNHRYKERKGERKRENKLDWEWNRTNFGMNCVQSKQLLLFFVIRKWKEFVVFFKSFFIKHILNLNFFFEFSVKYSKFFFSVTVWSFSTFNSVLHHWLTTFFFFSWGFNFSFRLLLNKFSGKCI